MDYRVRGAENRPSLQECMVLSLWEPVLAPGAKADVFFLVELMRQLIDLLS